MEWSAYLDACAINLRQFMEYVEDTQTASIEQKASKIFTF